MPNLGSVPRHSGEQGGSSPPLSAAESAERKREEVLSRGECGVREVGGL